MNKWFLSTKLYYTQCRGRSVILKSSKLETFSYLLTVKVLSRLPNFTLPIKLEDTSEHSTVITRSKTEQIPLSQPRSLSWSRRGPSRKREKRRFLGPRIDSVPVACTGEPSESRGARLLIPRRLRWLLVTVRRRRSARSGGPLSLHTCFRDFCPTGSGFCPFLPAPPRSIPSPRLRSSSLVFDRPARSSTLPPLPRPT